MTAAGYPSTPKIPALSALGKAAITAGFAYGQALNLDFHAVMHWGSSASSADSLSTTRESAGQRFEPKHERRS